jgi:hypothetical protein
MNHSVLLKNWSGGCPSIPEGYNDGSLARSAWERRTQESVPLGYGVRFLPVKSELHAPCPIDGDTQLPIQTVPYGTDPSLRFFQALRARLPSNYPSGTVSFASTARLENRYD